MNVSLTPELEKFVSLKVDSGLYNSASEVIREALRLLESQESSRAAQLAAFQTELARRLADLDAGNSISGEELQKHFQRRSAERRKRSA
jgi:antitoxin ParD1/3/4